ncbi:hypothetical protein CVT25_011549, partial [Psilocybe cyanescens]
QHCEVPVSPYFVPKKQHKSKENNPQALSQAYVPMYGVDGTIEGYMQQSTKGGQNQAQIQSTLDVIPKSVNPTGQIMYTHTAEEHFIPISSHVLHPLPDEEICFEELVQAHPKTGPLGLMVGVPGVAEPEELVADISYEQLRIKKKAETRGDDFMAGFSKFMAEHPGLVLNARLGVVAVITVQSKFMWSNLVKHSLLERLINGMVNDATHDWWEEHGALLMVTLMYCPVFFYWVAGVISYTNGATAHHFQYHFIRVFDSIAHKAEEQPMNVNDAMFAEVMDFSDAEWNLKTDAENFIKECQQHFCAGVTCISCISGVVSPAQKEVFVS